MKYTVLLFIAPLLFLLAGCSMTTPKTDAIDTVIRAAVGESCLANDAAWRDTTTSKWLSENIGGDQLYWLYDTGTWTYNPPNTLQGDGDTAGFTYPGFGTFNVFVLKGDPIVVNASNANELPQLRFTSLELTCP